jgi:hypothetical protein
MSPKLHCITYAFASGSISDSSRTNKIQLFHFEKTNIGIPNVGLVRTKTLNSWLCFMIHQSLGTPFQPHCLGLLTNKAR